MPHSTSSAPVEDLKVTDYIESPYTNADWEVLGKAPGKEEFIPMQVENIFVESVTINSMFEDYGGVPEHQTETRWHLPEGMDYETQEALAKKQEMVDAQFVKLRPEELEEIKRKSFTAGKEEGVSSTVESNLNRMQGLENRLEGLISDVHKQLAEIEQSTARSGMELVLAICRKIIGTAVDINPEYIIDILKQAINKSGTSTIRTIRVSAEDMEFIDVIGVRKMISEYDGSWDFEADPTVKSGCIVETSSGEIDFQLDAAWERIKDKVLTVAR